MAIVMVAQWMTEAQLIHYAAFKGVRALSVYETEGAQTEMSEIIPETKIPRLAGPAWRALDGVDINLNDQVGTMDNFIAYCGDRGEYGLCKK